MLPWIIQSGIISFILIYLLHYLFTFFKDNLTVPKVIDLVNRPSEQYADLMKNNNTKPPDKPSSYTPPSDNNKPDMKSMKDELKNYLKDLKGKENNTSNNIMSSDMMGSSQYSVF